MRREERTVLRYAAFTATPDGGNPAGIVLDARGLSEAERQRIATEVGYSETAFVELGSGPGEYVVRFFSPLSEVRFCGHATIATAVALAERDGVGPLAFDTLAGRIDVATERIDGLVRASLTSVETWSRPADPAQVDEALAALGWSAGDLSEEFPPHESFGGERHLVLVAATRRRLADLDYDVDALGAVMTTHDWTTVQLVWHEPDRRVVHSRNPFPVGGIVEDPATGAAAAAYGGYLRALGLVEGRQSFTILQGEDLGRPSRLDVVVDADSPRVVVAGTAVEIASHPGGGDGRGPATG